MMGEPGAAGRPLRRSEVEATDQKTEGRDRERESSFLMTSFVQSLLETNITSRILVSGAIHLLFKPVCTG